MEYLHFEYQMRINYTLPATKCYFTIKCIPRDTERQHLLGKEISLSPETEYSLGEDSYHNKQIYGCIPGKHDEFIYRISGDVEILQNKYEETATEERIGMYRFPFGKCQPGEKLKEYYHSLDFSLYNSTYDKCVYLMHELHNAFSYVPAATEVCTMAEEAWELGKGVCQDYAHIYITLLRLAGIPARYVCGLIVGEGASHAWAEALCDGKWVGFDPTNDCLVLDNHIKLGDGRDASECAINRGIMWGGGEQTQTISVSVEKRIKQED